MHHDQLSCSISDERFRIALVFEGVEWTMIESPFAASYELQFNVRPVKHTYFIPEDDEAALKRVIQLVCTQWGGIRSLIVPVKSDMSTVPLYTRLLNLHEPDRFIDCVTRFESQDDRDNQDDDLHVQLHRKLSGQFPTREVVLRREQFFVEDDATAHALHTPSDESLLRECLTSRRLTPESEHEYLSLAIYGAIYPGQEEDYAAAMQVRHEEVAIGSKEFWSSQIDGSPFASVLNLTAYNVSAFRVTDLFAANSFNVVVGDDVNTICMYWNLRATQDAVQFASDRKRRTILTPLSVLANRHSAGTLFNIIRANLPTPGVSSNLNITFSVWNEQTKDQLLQVLSDNSDQLETLEGRVQVSHHFGAKAPQIEDLSGKRLTYKVSLPDFPRSYKEGLLQRLPRNTPLTTGGNILLCEPEVGFRNRAGGEVALDIVCAVWDRYPRDKAVAQLITENSWFSRYGLTTIRSLPDCSFYVSVNLPTEWDTLQAYFRERGFAIRPSPPDNYASGVIQVLGGWDMVSILESKLVYLLLDTLALQSTKKIAQRIERAIGTDTQDAESIRALLRNIEAIPELKGVPRTYAQLHDDQRLLGYRKQLLTTLNMLAEHRVLKRGLYITCPYCGAPDWYPLDHLAEELQCSGCSHRFIMPVEQPPGSEVRWQYRLNTLINRAVDQDVLVPLLAMRYLMKNKTATCRVVGLELEGEDLLRRELDYLFVSEQKLYAGECKAGTELAAKDIETALLALNLGVTEFRFCTIRRFSGEAQALITEAKNRAVAAGHLESAIAGLDGDELLGEAI